MRYTIGKVSKLFRISTDTLRHYDRLGLLKPDIDPNSGYRFYDINHIQKLEFILRSKYLEIPLSEVKDILESEDLNKYEDLLKKQQEIIKEKIKHLENLNIILSRSEKDLNEVINYKKNYNFEKLKVLNIPKNYYMLNLKEYMEDSNIMNILGDICSENFDCPNESNIEDQEFHIYNIENENNIVEDEKNIYLLETSKNKVPLDKYLLSKYGKIPTVKVDEDYIVSNFYGNKDELKEYLLLLHNHFRGDSKKGILIKSSFCLYKKVDSKYYWEILYRF